MPHPRAEDRKIVAFPVPPARTSQAMSTPPADDRGRIVLFTGVRCERYADEAAFTAAMAALALAEAGRAST